MAKTIKFNLICDQKPVRTIEDLQQNFSIEDVLAYYHNGLLERWLRVRGYVEQLEKVFAIVETKDIDIIKKLIEIFEVAADECSIEEDIYILNYQEERKELLNCYEQENFKKQSIIDDYAAGYRQLVDGILQNPNDISQIKANIREIVQNYAWVLELDHRKLFNVLKDNNCVLAIMCLLMVEECRKYYLPIEKEGEDGKLFSDISFNADKRVMYSDLCTIVGSGEKMDMLGENLHGFSGITDGYWKDLEPKGKKYMIISMETGDYVRSAGNRDEEFSSSDVSKRFLIVDGIDYKSNSASHTLLYMEV